MKTLIFFILFCCSGGFSAWAENSSIVFNISPKGYPPYMIHDGGKNPRGLMIEVLRAIASQKGYSLIFERVTRKRVDELISLGELDATPHAKKWSNNPQKYEFTDVVVRIRDVLFSLKSNPVPFRKVEDLFGKELGTHLGYYYPVLKPHFDKGTISRTDASGELAILRMLIRKRTQAAILNEFVGKWHIKNNKGWKGKFIIAKKELGGYDYRIMFNKKWKPFVQFFNQELVKMKEQGKLQKIIERYQ